MKHFSKFLAVLLALLIAFGISAAAAEPTPEERDNLPELILGQETTGILEGEPYELWYRFTAEESGYHRFIVNGSGIRYSVHYEHGNARQYFSTNSARDNKVDITAGATEYVRVYHAHPEYDSNREFSITIEYVGPFNFWKEMKEMFSFDLSNFSVVKFLATIGMLPVVGIMLGFFFAPFSIGGTLILSLISALFLPVTLLLSPFMLIQSKRDRIKS